MGLKAVEISGGSLGLPHRGTAKVVDMGIDLDTMKRYVTYEFDPPTAGGLERHTVTYASREYEDGKLVLKPMSEGAERLHVTRAAEIMGYDVDWNGWEV